jgi:uncharacterized protein (TIGR03382 family)
LRAPRQAATLTGVKAPLCAALLLATPALAARPTLSGPEVLRPSADGRFLTHYTLQGADALTLGDGDANGVPDEVDDVERGMQRAYEAFVVGDGWPAPPGDEGRGGDDRLDVYVRDIDAFGYAYFERVAAGGDTSYFEIDPANSKLGRAVARSIAAHELHHALQAAVTVRAEPWVYEATSTWVQYSLDLEPELTLLRDLSWTLRLQGASRGLADTGARFEYAGMTWVQFLLDRQKLPRPAVLTLWKAMGAAGGWEAGHRTFLAPASLEDVVVEYAVWNLFACRRDDGRHYSALLPCSIDAEVPAPKAAPPSSGDSLAVGRFGASYVELKHDCRSADLALTVSPAAGPAAVRVLRGRAAGDSPVEQGPADGGTFTVAGWNDDARTVLVLVNLGAQETTFRWSASVAGSYQPAPDFAAARALTVSPAALPAPLQVGEAVQLGVTGAFGSCASGLELSASAPWRSSDPAVVSVDGGSVLALSAGTADVFVDNGALTSNRVSVTVQAPGCGCSGSPGAGALAWVALVTLDTRRRRRVRSPGQLSRRTD